MQQIFYFLFFVVVGSWIRDIKNQGCRIQDKHPGSATLVVAPVREIAKQKAAVGSLLDNIIYNPHKICC
jgi:hypothetical protein